MDVLGNWMTTGEHPPLRLCECGQAPRLAELMGYEGFQVKCPCGKSGEKFGAAKMPEGVHDASLWLMAAIDSWNRGEQG